MLLKKRDLECGKNSCTARRNGKVQNYNDQVTREQVLAYTQVLPTAEGSMCAWALVSHMVAVTLTQGKNDTLKKVAEMVGPNGTIFSKLSGPDGPKYGGEPHCIHLHLLVDCYEKTRFRPARPFCLQPHVHCIWRHS